MFFPEGITVITLWRNFQEVGIRHTLGNVPQRRHCLSSGRQIKAASVALYYISVFKDKIPSLCWASVVRGGGAPQQIVGWPRGVAQHRRRSPESLRTADPLQNPDEENPT